MCLWLLFTRELFYTIYICLKTLKKVSNWDLKMYTWGDCFKVSFGDWFKVSSGDCFKVSYFSACQVSGYNVWFICMYVHRRDLKISFFFLIFRRIKYLGIMCGLYVCTYTEETLKFLSFFLFFGVSSIMGILCDFYLCMYIYIHMYVFTYSYYAS